MFWSCGSDDDDNNQPPGNSSFYLEEIAVGDQVNLPAYTDVEVDPTIRLSFSATPAEETFSDNIVLRNKDNNKVALRFTIEEGQVFVRPAQSLSYESGYTFSLLSGLTSAEGEKIQQEKNYDIRTTLDLSDKFPRISTEELLTLVQEKTFGYFWDFGHPVSGMARERSTSGDVVTTGGTGFGVMAIIVAIEREFITRAQGVERVQQIVSFLKEKCTAYHGAYAHWINGTTGQTVPFSEYDNGADLVETALLFQGLLTARSYFNTGDAAETQLRGDITGLWEAIEWNFFRNGENVLYWHWSPEYEWKMNLPVRGWNECLIVYVLAASSPTHPIARNVYTEGFAGNGSMVNGKKYYDILLPLGESYGGPLFFSHYSFLGLDPRNLSDQFANYWEQNVNHSRINYEYCVTNPRNFKGYGEDCWGLTASDGNTGYSAHSPLNDKGVITPTAAISSMPYTPEESLRALEFFYYKVGNKLWSRYGFYDAFNLTEGWFDDQYLAIDQGPVIIMLENYRTGLLWTYFMSVPEIKEGLTRLGFNNI